MRKPLDIQKLRAVYDRAAKRYDTQHSIFTADSDQRGRELAVELTVASGDMVLDAGTGTGSTGLLAARKTGQSGQVIMYDISEKMLSVARNRATSGGLSDRAKFIIGDIISMPFADGTFDVVLSTYSTCPLYDPVKGVLEMYRVLKNGGKLGVAHSAEPDAVWLKWLAHRAEALVWRFPAISLGCQPISILPTLLRADATLLFKRKIGIPLWPFLVFVAEKPKLKPSVS